MVGGAVLLLAAASTPAGAAPRDRLDAALAAADTVDFVAPRDEASAADGLQKALALVEMVTLDHLTRHRITLDRYSAVLKVSIRSPARPDPPQHRARSGASEPSTRRTSFAPSNELGTLGELGPTSIPIDRQSAAVLKAMAKDVKKDADAIHDHALDVDRKQVLQRLPQNLGAAHQVVASGAYTAIYKPLPGSTTEQIQRVRELEKVVLANLKAAGSSLSLFGLDTGEPEGSETGNTEKKLERLFHASVDGVVQQIKDTSSVPPTSCKGLAAACGASQVESCCASPLVPGGTIKIPKRSGAKVTQVSLKVAEVRLDKFEVTRERFRAFIKAWSSGFRPAVGSGKHPSGGSAIETVGGAEKGWEPGWNAQLSKDVAGWNKHLDCGVESWTPNPSPPITIR